MRLFAALWLPLLFRFLFTIVFLLALLALLLFLLLTVVFLAVSVATFLALLALFLFLRFLFRLLLGRCFKIITFALQTVQHAETQQAGTAMGNTASTPGFAAQGNTTTNQQPVITVKNKEARKTAMADEQRAGHYTSKGRRTASSISSAPFDFRFLSFCTGHR